MKRITKNSIDDLYTSLEIVKIVEHFGVKLTRAGVNYKAKSPFTEENTPSFIVSPTKNIFKCFSTGIGGNGVKFIQEKEGCEWIKAIELAASIMDISLEYEELDADEKIKYQEEVNAKKVVDIINDKYQTELVKLPKEHWVNEVLQERGYNEEVIKNFGLGYAPDKTAFITQSMIENGQLALSNTLGYSKAKNNVSYDFFRDRLMFPIHNYNGEVIAFGGRRSNDAKNFNEEGKEKYPKYLNSSESELYNKQNVLYAFHLAKNEIRKQGTAILVEGYTDVISLHNAGVENTIATCGTALTIKQAKKLKTICNEIIVFRDGDNAGIKATHRDVAILLDLGFKVWILVDEEGQDPDEIVRREGEEISDFIKYSKQDAIIWLSELALIDSISDTYYKHVDDIAKERKERTERVSETIGKRIKRNTSFIEPSNKASKDLIAENKKLQKQLDAELKKINVECDNELKALVKYDAFKKSEAVKEIAIAVASIADTIQRADYTSRIAKIFEVKEKDFKAVVDQTIESGEKLSKTEAGKKKGLKIGVPEGGDPDQFMEDGFCEVGNTYFFQEQNGFFKGTNFKINPLFHIYGRNDNKRLCEVISEKGIKTLVDFESKDFVNFGRLQETLIEEGNYFWYAGTSNLHFKLVTKKILDNFIMAHELKTLGIQAEGFYAFADCVYHQNTLKRVNQYGIIQLDNEDDEADNSEYSKKIKHYYSPAFSEIYKNIREDDDPYENDRFLIYKESPVTIEQWMKQLVRVYGFEKASIGIAFLFGTIIRSYIVKQGEFPLMGMFGEKGSGKSQFAESLSAFFFHMMPAFDLNNGTMVGFYRRLARTKDTVAYLEEYSDNIKFEMGQAMKNSFDNRGREKGSMSSDNRTSISKVNTSIMYAGQYLPGFDEGSLAERTLILHFQKKMADDYTIEDKTEFMRLKNWQEKGLTSLVIDVLKYRTDMMKQFHPTVNEIQRNIREEFKSVEYSERMMMNYANILAPIKMLQGKIDFPFTYEEFYKHCKNEIISNSDLVTEIGGMTEFWKILEYLVTSTALVNIDQHVKIERSKVVKGRRKIAGKMEDDHYINTDESQILYIDFNKVYGEYQKEAVKRQVEVIGESTLKNYFKSKKYFVRSNVTKRIGDRSPSCYTFNYSMMTNTGLLNIENTPVNYQEIDEEQENIITKSENLGAKLYPTDDDLPI